jgi:hypothetical protein
LNLDFILRGNISPVEDQIESVKDHDEDIVKELMKSSQEQLVRFQEC